MSVFGSDVNIESASEDRKCDYLIDDSRAQTVDVYEAWDLEDGENVLVVGEDVPDDLAEAVEDTTIYDVRCAREVESATVVEREIGVRERRAFYVEEPPRRVAESIGHREAVELLDRRGREASAGAMEGAWLFPRIDEVGIHYIQTDDAGEQYETYQTIRSLTDEERAIAEGEWPDEDDADLGLGELAERISEESALYDRQAQYAAAYADGAESFPEVLAAVQREFDAELTYNDVTKGFYQMRDRQHEVAWQVVHVWPELPEEHRSEEMEMIVDALAEADVNASPRDPEWLADGQVGDGR